MEVPVVLCFRHSVFNSVQKITSYPMIFNRTLATWLRSSYNSRDLTKKHCPKVKLSVDRQENWKTSELGWNTSARGAPDSESFSGKKFEFAMINLLGLAVHGLHFSSDNVFSSIRCIWILSKIFGIIIRHWETAHLPHGDPFGINWLRRSRGR